MMDAFLMGAIAMASWSAGLFFLRFWRDTRDRLFLIFALAFWLLGLTRLGLVVLRMHEEEHTYVYWIRLIAFVLIALAIVDKNRPRRTGFVDTRSDPSDGSIRTGEARRPSR